MIFDSSHHAYQLSLLHKWLKLQAFPAESQFLLLQRGQVGPPVQETHSMQSHAENDFSFSRIPYCINITVSTLLS